MPSLLRVWRRVAASPRRRVAPAVVSAAVSALLVAQVYVPGPQVLTFLSDIDDSDQPYALYLPRSFDAAKKYPLVISLHHSDENQRLNLRRVFGRGNQPRESDSEAARYFPPLRDVDFIVACPLARGSMGFQGIAAKDVYDVLADVKRRFPIDDDRVYLTGIEMGASGALMLALTRPDVWAAVAAVCPTAAPGIEDLAPNALNFAVHLFHGEQDPAVSAEISRQWHRRFLDAGVHSEYLEYRGVRHNAWDYAYRNGAIFDWFAKFHRVRYPERVRFISRAYQYNAAWWVRLDVLTPGALATIDARFAGPNRIEVATHNLDGFTLRPVGHPHYARQGSVVVTVDGTVLRTHAAESLAFTRSPGGWTLAGPGPRLPGYAKRAGSEGPISDAVASRHIYVYGTADGLGRERAVFAAQWSNARRHIAVSFAVKADKDVTAADIENNNLVLFGTKETNSLIARFAKNFPLELNAGAADYGLVFIAPLGSHYALVNSGLAWWTGADQWKRSGWRTMPSPFRVLDSFGDYLLFKGSLEGIVAEGRFDQNWKLPASQVDKMKATGAVVVR